MDNVIFSELEEVARRAYRDYDVEIAAAIVVAYATMRVASPSTSSDSYARSEPTGDQSND